MKRLIGLVFILGGALVLLSNLDIFRVTDLIDYLWPSALILLGLASIIENRRLTIWGLILVGIGGLCCDWRDRINRPCHNLAQQPWRFYVPALCRQK